MERSVSLMEILDARERRVQRQQLLLRQFQLPLISFTMNIAGPVKNSPLIRRAFDEGCRLLEEQLARAKAPCPHRECSHADTGNEAFYAVDLPPHQLKRLTAELEDATAAGRLFDMDVLTADGEKLSRQALGLPERRCLLCDSPAHLCARSRAHSVEALQAETARLLEEAITDSDAELAAQAACRALLYEVCTTPKPGLVDRMNSGSHTDMDIFTFMDSAAALWPYFACCLRIGRRTRAAAAVETFRALRVPGKLAEGAMLTATAGVNTHKGAIFSFGILCAALGRLDRERWQSEHILAQCAAMTAGLVERDFAGLDSKSTLTHGERLYLEYGITGVRGQAEAGFPAVSEVGLPKLREGLARGFSLEVSGRAALLAMLSACADTNLIARSDRATQQRVAGEVGDLLRREPFPGDDTLAALDRQFIRQNLSPGGSADLLAICYFLHFLDP